MRVRFCASTAWTLVTAPVPTLTLVRDMVTRVFGKSSAIRAGLLVVNTTGLVGVPVMRI